MIEAIEAGIPDLRKKGPDRAMETAPSRPAEAPPVDRPEPPPYKPGPLPPARSAATRQDSGTLEPGGYRPPRNTIAAVLKDEILDDRPVFDRGKDASRRLDRSLVPSQKGDLKKILAEAVRNTARMSIPEKLDKE